MELGALKLMNMNEMEAAVKEFDYRRVAKRGIIVTSVRNKFGGLITHSLSSLLYILSCYKMLLSLIDNI